MPPMRMSVIHRRTAILYGCAVLAVVLPGGGRAEQQTARAGDGDWPMYRHDYCRSGHSPLTQIDTRNVTASGPSLDLRLARRFARRRRTGRGGLNSEATPIVVGAVMYLPAAGRIVALQSDTGKELWRYAVTGSVPSRRGVAYWAGDASQPATHRLHGGTASD